MIWGCAMQRGQQLARQSSEYKPCDVNAFICARWSKFENDVLGHELSMSGTLWCSPVVLACGCCGRWKGEWSRKRVTEEKEEDKRRGCSQGTMPHRRLLGTTNCSCATLPGGWEGAFVVNHGESSRQQRSKLEELGLGATATPHSHGTRCRQPRS
jgi:hypothetical protein